MKIPALALLVLIAVSAAAQEPSDNRPAEIREIRAELARLTARLDALERPTAADTAGTAPAATAAAPAVGKAPSEALDAPPEAIGTLAGTTINFGIDGYYAYNFNQPAGRTNLLRAYDVSSNSFSINQATLMVERLPQAMPGQRFGGRVDLQFGQATETLQGSSANEQRPQVWRNLFQAYGSYLAPLGSGLQMDFGKFASSLGVEGNYTKDQINYSRAYLFNYLPFYHTGLRATYAATPKVTLAYWLVNGAQQTEDFNGFKSQAFLFTLKPASTVTWNVNYYFGQEQRDVPATLNPGIPVLPTQPGLPSTNLSPAPNGREHIFDTYATWAATPKLTFIGEADFVLNRTFANSQPQRVAAGAFYAKYALPRGYNLAARAEYFDDRGGLFSGATQALKEATFTFDRQVQPGLIVRAEYRRDFSNQRFFLTQGTNPLAHSQTTATLGLVYWWGQKQGSW